MIPRSACFFCFCVFIAVFTASAQQTVRIPKPETVLSTLDRSHPRLMFKDSDLGRIKKQRETDAVLSRYIDDVVKKADEFCRKPPVEYIIIGPRLLQISRECLDRVYTLGLAWRLTGKEIYARKAEENLLAVCAFKDWNPSHFLDTAEMSHAVGIGYDWLYHYFSEENREKIRQGLIRHGMEPGVAAYEGRDKIPRFWVEAEHNWNQVCNSGLTVGALAIAETDPRYAEIIVPRAVESLPHALATYAPDGAWPEGPGYWHYATRYTAYGLAALETALGADFGLSEMEGISVTGLFPIYTTGPTGLFLNFADSGEKARRMTMPCMFWLARRFDNRFISDCEHDMIERYGAEPEHIVWYVPRSRMQTYNPDLDRRFRGPVEVAVLRSGWNDPEALFVGVKAGYNRVNHAHLDLGNFELDALGVRWARDLGSDDYNMPGYFDTKQGGKRWTYYRMRSVSHNVPLIDGADQELVGMAQVLKFISKPVSAGVVVDISTAYAPPAKKVTRGIALIDNRRVVLVEDEFELEAPCKVDWGMTTDAAITLDGSMATLVLEGKKLTARILEPSDARFAVESAGQQPPEKANTGVSRLMVRLGNRTGSVRIAVLLSPEWKGGAFDKDVSVKPLDEW
ncbi:heparinase II/III-family protein [bacterium]|nr:heparinase II/III-family protein [bacterium]